MASTSKNSSALTCQDLFLPESLVRLVIKICKSYNISKYDQFSILDTLNFALFNDFKESLSKDAFKDEEKMYIMILNIIRLCEKFNNSSSSFAKKIDTIFKELGINKNVYNVSELESYKMMDYEVKNPVVLEAIYDFVENNLNSNDQKNQVFDFSNDLLVLVYLWKDSIFNRLLKTMSHEDSIKIIKNQKLQAVAVFFVVLKILNNSKYNEIFEKITNEMKEEITEKEVNQLCAVIFGLIQNNKSA
ncbi:unnamed protein product [Chironomus riparius]|uniref:Uncharacterized protein n=1 Tax=Chironomus riparius TaxID=315576 RepID=A0A9N9WXF3_9DIPT|nr:unnamed protein product [Chironomus riparius]